MKVHNTRGKQTFDMHRAYGGGAWHLYFGDGVIVDGGGSDIKNFLMLTA